MVSVCDGVSGGFEQILVPTDCMGMIIGQAGYRIKDIQESTGVRIDRRGCYNKMTILSLIGDSGARREAKMKIYSIISTDSRRGGPPDEIETIVIEKKVAGMVVGWRGSMIREIMKKSGAVVNGSDWFKPNTVKLSIIGKEDQRNRAKDLIYQLVQSDRDNAGR